MSSSASLTQRLARFRRALTLGPAGRDEDEREREVELAPRGASMGEALEILFAVLPKGGRESFLAGTVGKHPEL